MNNSPRVTELKYTGFMIWLNNEPCSPNTFHRAILSLQDMVRNFSPLRMASQLWNLYSVSMGIVPSPENLKEHEEIIAIEANWIWRNIYVSTLQKNHLILTDFIWRRKKLNMPMIFKIIVKNNLQYWEFISKFYLIYWQAS